MIKPELYHKTVGILYDAYFADTLEKGNCFACAVGNIVAANMGKKFCVDPEAGNVFQKYYWKGYAPYSDIFNGANVEWFPLTGVPNKETLSTGYSIDELMRIENAFEKSPGVGVQDRMFNGLVAVLEVLAQIHQVTDEDLLTANNKRFKDHYNKRVSIG